RGFRRRPSAVRATPVGVASAPARYVDPSELVPGGTRTNGDVIRIVVREPGRSYAPGESQSAQRLHRPRGDMVALDAWRLASRPLLYQNDTDSPPGQVERQTEPDRPSTDDRNLSLAQHGHWRSYCTPG